MIVHFVCVGNVYRSRLGEAYLNSKQLKGIKAISSGLAADRNSRGPISWYAQRLIQKNNLVNYESPNWQKTTRELLQKGDLTIFMGKAYFEYCKNNLNFSSQKYEIWNIPDVDNASFAKGEAYVMEISERTFEDIKHKVDELVNKLL